MLSRLGIVRRFAALRGEVRQKLCRCSSGEPELVEDALHGNIDGVVVAVDRFWVVWTTDWVERLSGGKEGFDSLVTQNHQGGHRPETARQRFVAAGVADPAHDVLAAKFLQIISGLAGAVV